MNDEQLNALQTCGSATVGGPAGGEVVRLGDILEGLDALGIEPADVRLWSNDPIVVEVDE